MFGFLSLERPKSLLKQWLQLLSSPTSFYLAFLLSLQIVALLLLALTVPIGIRYLVLPSSIQQEIPLNLVFLPCEDNLHGICSFPTAQINVQELDVFSPSTYYQISIRLHFSDAETNFNLGMFQNELNLLDARGTNVGRWRRTGLLKQPGYFTKAIWIFFFPLYFLGYFHNYHIMEIPIAGEYYASVDKMAQQLTYSLQDRFAQVDTAYLLVNAKFGFIRNFLYHWPLTTFFFLYVATLMTGVFVMAIFWGHKGYTTYTGSRGTTAESSRRTSEEIVPLNALAKMNPSENVVPDYYNEVPECPTSPENVAGWRTGNVISVANTPPLGLRNRKSNPYYT